MSPSNSISPTHRFTTRVENYRRYRPGYPPELLPFLVEHAGLTPRSVVGDVGAGTGLLTQMLLEHGCTVFAVEPNRAMRRAAEEAHGGHPNFHSVDAAAEATTLPDHSIDLVAAAQAFHWFDRPKAKREFQRILKPGGRVALIWNTRDESNPMAAAYQAILEQYCPEYPLVVHTKVASPEALHDFFAPHPFHTTAFPNAHSLDYPALEGRLLSSSYAPMPDHPNHQPMLAALRSAFDRLQSGGRVEFLYRTELYLGQV